MKRMFAFVLIVVFVSCSVAFATDVTSRIDFDAMQQYAQAATADAERRGHPYTMTASNDEGSYSLEASVWTPINSSFTFEEALTSEKLPIPLRISYRSINNAIAFVFDSKTVSEIPQSVEMYADGIRIQGGVLTQPEGSISTTSISGFFFDLKAVHRIMMAQDVFMRLVTDKGTSYIEVSKENMLLPYCMLGLVCNGAEYSWKDSSYYLDQKQLWDQIENRQPQETIQAVSSIQTKSFQTDYEAIDKAAKSAFLLEVYDANDQLIGTGSGFVAFDQSTMITNEHVIEGGSYVIAYSDQYQSSYKLTELKTVNAEADIAILKFDTSANIQPLTVDSDAKLLRGQPVTAIGSPQGVLNTVSSGNISNIVFYSDQIPDYIQFTAPISPGSSGGALFNDQGAVIGLCVSYLKEAESMYYAIPIKYVEEMYKESQRTDAITLTSYNSLDLAAPELISASEGVWVSWEEVPGAQSYVVYRRLAGSNSAFTRLYEMTVTSYLDKTVQDDKVYEYRIGIVSGDTTRMSPIATITHPGDAAAATPEATPAPIAIKIDTTVTASKGEYTISWTDDSNTPYRISYTPFSFMGETYGDIGISANSYTTAWMIPGEEYRVTVTNAKGISATANVKVPAASSFEDGNITASKVGIQVAPRCDEDGQNGPGNPIYMKTLYAEVITVNTRDFGWSFGLYYRFDLPSFKGRRTYLQSVVFRAPNGFEYIWDVGRYEFTYLSNGGWWKWNIMGEEFFQALVDKYNVVPAGQYYVDLYWDGMLVNSKSFQVY